MGYYIFQIESRTFGFKTIWCFGLFTGSSFDLWSSREHGLSWCHLLGPGSNLRPGPMDINLIIITLLRLDSVGRLVWVLPSLFPNSYKYLSYFGIIATYVMLPNFYFYLFEEDVSAMTMRPVKSEIMLLYQKPLDGFLNCLGDS